MVSVDFAEIEALQRQGRWSEATQAMVEAAQCVERAGRFHSDLHRHHA